MAGIYCRFCNPVSKSLTCAAVYVACFRLKRLRLNVRLFGAQFDLYHHFRI